jgi:hypothetical protein
MLERLSHEPRLLVSDRIDIAAAACHAICSTPP